MGKVIHYPNFPFALVVSAVALSLAIYALGATILAGFGRVAVALYLLYCLGIEIHVLKFSCVDCFYYGKWCAFGRGKLASFLFRQGEPHRFTCKCISWRELLPDLLASLIPLAGGMALLVHGFSWGLVGRLATLLVLSTGGNYLIRSRIACKYCKQRALGCPAEQFFGQRLG